MANVIHEKQSCKRINLKDLATLLDGQMWPTDSGHNQVCRVGFISAADTETVVFAENDVTLREAMASQAGVVLVSPTLAATYVSATGDEAKKTLIVVSQPKLGFARTAQFLRAENVSAGVHPQACVAGDAVFAEEVSIGPFAVVESGVMLGKGTRVDAGAFVGAGCVLGAACHIFPRAVLYPGVVLGARVMVHAGAVLGSDGFGYVRDAQTGAYTQFPQQGRLFIEDDVDIGANTTIDRGALEETRIGRGTKIDNLVHVGHNVQVSTDVVIAAQTGISGSSSIGASAVVAGQVGIADHVTIGTGAILGAQCGVPSHKRIDGPGVLFWGTPARPITQYLKELAVLARLTKSKRTKRVGE